MIVLFKRFLGFIGFKFCVDCGRRLVFARTEYLAHYYEVDIYECPHCDHLDGFDI